MDMVARVPNEIADLLPSFRANREREVGLLRDALERKDFGQLQVLGERMFSIGNPYGFRQITTFGRQVREACAAQDLHAIRHVVALYRQYLETVEIRLEEVPAERPVWTAARRAEEGLQEPEKPPTIRARSDVRT